MAYWDISTAVYSGKSFYVGDQSPKSTSVRFKPDGLIMYIVDRLSATIYQYTLSIAWDVITSIYSGIFLDVGKQDKFSLDISFNLDGSIMYMAGEYHNIIYQYDLLYTKHTPWDVSSAVYRRIYLDVSEQNPHLRSIFFSSDGANLYTLNSSTQRIYQYILSIPWEITSGLYSGISLYIGNLDYVPRNISFSPDGVNLYFIGDQTDTVYQYILSIPWDLSTSVYFNKSPLVGTPSGWSFGISFSNIGSEMYILRSILDRVDQWYLPGVIPPPPKKEASRTGVYSFKTLKI